MGKSVQFAYILIIKWLKINGICSFQPDFAYSVRTFFSGSLFMQKIFLFVGYFILFAVVFGFSPGLKAQTSLSCYAIPFATDRILVQFQHQLVFEQRRALLMGEEGLLPLRPEMELPAPGVAIIPLDGNQNATTLRDLLDRLRQIPGIEWANPFVLGPGGGYAGILDHFWVKLLHPSDYGFLEHFAKETGTVIEEPEPWLPLCYRLRADKHSLADPGTLSLFFRNLGLFAWAEPDLLFSPQVHSNDPFYANQWALENTGSPIQGSGTPGADVSAPEAWTITRGDSSVKIAILDSGVDFLHPDLQANMLPGFDATGLGSTGYPASDFPEDGHGTSCAGIIAAVADNNLGVAGVAPECSLIPVRMFYYQNTPFGVQPYTTGQWVLDAINWAAHTAGADVVSSSVGLPDLLIPLFFPTGVQFIEEALEMAVQNGRDGKGMPVFFSSGNDDADGVLWPSRLPYVISVTATSMCDERKSPSSCDGINWGGNYGDSLDIGAPGVSIYTTDVQGTQGYNNSDYTATFSGTSAACPYAAGVMGLILSANPTLTISEARFLLESTCDRTGGYDYSTVKQGGNWSRELGYGRINAFAAVSAASVFTSVDPLSPDAMPIRVYPNPASDFIWMELPVNARVEWTLWSVEGKLLLSGTSLGADRIRIELPAHLPAGICLLRARQEGRQNTVKIRIL
jgi:subtilisin family serine protease